LEKKKLYNKEKLNIDSIDMYSRIMSELKINAVLCVM